jgi:PAS domain S-box-containing protein
MQEQGVPETGRPNAAPSHALFERALTFLGKCQSLPTLWRLGLAILIVVAAVSIRLAFLGMLGDRLAYLTLHPAVATAAIVGGLPAGILAAVLAAALAHGLIAPIQQASDLIGLAAFLFSCAIIVAMAWAMRVFQSRVVDAERIGQNEQRMRDFIAQVPAAIAMFDCGMRYLATSERWKADYNLTADLIGRSHYEVFPEITEPWKEIHRRAMAGEALGNDNDCFVRSDGCRQRLKWRVQPWHDGRGEIGGIVIFCEDMTERKRMEERLAEADRLELVGQLSGGIAHDYNNLLTVIVGNAELLSEHLEVRRDLQQLAEAISGAGDRAAELTQRLLAFSRRQALNPTAIDLNLLIESKRQRLQASNLVGIEIVTDYQPDLPPVYADPAQLNSAIVNILLNAEEAIRGNGRVTIATSVAVVSNEANDLAPGTYVQIAISDNGVGMEDKVKMRAFEPFFTTKEFGTSSGLGLSMVYGFAKQSNGHVAIDSEPDRGTTVRIYLPPADNANLMQPAPVAAGRDLRWSLSP